MSRDLYEFTWPVTPDGYAWQHVKSPAQHYWVLTWPHMGGTKGRVYQPLREFTGLFRTFAFTRPDRDSILAFAKRFGRLGCGTAEISIFRLAFSCVCGEDLEPRTWCHYAACAL
jgi:hypothetical protein